LVISYRVFGCFPLVAIGGLALGSVGLVIPGKLSVPGVFLLFIDHDHTIYALGCGTKSFFRKSIGNVSLSCFILDWICVT
jgi:hypothetical protein